VVSAADNRTLVSLGYVLGVEIAGLDPPQRDGWRRFEIASTSNPVVDEHATLMSFITTPSPRGLTRSGGSPVRILELLFAILDEAEHRELADRIRKHLKANGVTRDSVEVKAAKPLPNPVIGRGGTGPGRGRKTPPQESHFTSYSGSSYLATRLARDHPALAAEVEAGHLSIRAAAHEAGIVKARDPLRELQRWWVKTSDEDRSAFEIYLTAAGAADTVMAVRASTGQCL
jgi:hypothetical protein